MMNAPKKVTFLLALILAALGIITELGLVSIPFVSAYSFWFVVAGYGLLFLGSIFKGL